MEGFLNFLKSSKNSLSSLPKNLHLVLGNESCDLDSTISALIFAYHISRRKPTQETLALPILNVSKENFSLRSENCFVLKQAGISLDTLTYRDDIDFRTLLLKCNVTVTLVDHHILSKTDDVLEKAVIQIIDHRPVDISHKWDRTKVDIRIEQVGSCATLVTDEILKDTVNDLTASLAYLLYQVIIYDTIALLPENGKAKDLDISIATTLENTFNFKDDRKKLFDTLWAAHNDISHLSVRQLLYKDLKLVEGVYVPGLPMLVEDFLKLEDAFVAVENFAKENQVTCVVLVGLDARNGLVCRDTAIYSTSKEDKLTRSLLEIFKHNKEYNFEFEERSSGFDKVVLLHVHNTKLSRKQLVPLIKQAVTSK